MTIRLTNPDTDRYQRLRLIRWWDQERLKSSRVLVLGAGALGNEVVKNLALLGIGRTWIIDFDRIETTNLTRSALFRAGDEGAWKCEMLAERASAMNPDCRFVGLAADVRSELGLGFLGQMDLVFGCMDNREARYFANRYCYLLGKTFIDGGLDTLNGSVSIFRPPQTACYECTLNSTDRAELQKRISCLKSVEPEIKHHVPTAPTIASITGGMQVQIGIRALHGLDIPAGKRIGLYGLSDVFFDIKLEISEDCGLHASVDPLPPERHRLALPETTPLKDVLVAANKTWGAEQLCWDFDRDLIVGLQCTGCASTKEFVGTNSIYSDQSNCSCGSIFKPQITGFFAGTEPWANRSFRELGFPREHVYCATGPSGRFYFTMEAS